jgi:hypothetical protein
MLTVTPAAREHLANMLSETKAPEGAAIRFVRSQQGIGVTVDNPSPQDTPFAHEGQTVLILDDEISGLLVDRTLDVEQTQEGQKLALT